MSKKILLIDDDELILKTVGSLLRRHGYEVTLAEDGFDAIERMEGLDPDLIICDVRMPGMDGLATVQRIRDEMSKAGKKKAPEIFLTGYAEFSLERRAKSMGVVGYLYKPFELDAFIKIIEKALSNG